MRIEAYLSIYGDEVTIRALHQETKVANASVRQHVKVKAQWSDTGEDMPWSWATPHVSIDVNNPDDGLKALLAYHRPIFDIIKKHHGSKTRIYLRMITQYDGNEHPRGLFLSAETVSLLSELGGALDDDVYGWTFPSNDG